MESCDTSSEINGSLHGDDCIFRAYRMPQITERGRRDGAGPWAAAHFIQS